jgi:hypothetical protein
VYTVLTGASVAAGATGSAGFSVATGSSGWTGAGVAAGEHPTIVTRRIKAITSVGKTFVNFICFLLLLIGLSKSISSKEMLRHMTINNLHLCNAEIHAFSFATSLFFHVIKPNKKSAII